MFIHTKKTKKNNNIYGYEFYSFRKVKDLTKKRRGLQVLKRILSEMDADLIYEQ